MATQSVKDILNTEVPKPSFVLSPSVSAPLPSGVTVTRNGQDNVARTLDPYSGKFEQVGEDTPRVYGSDQSLLVEGASRTNCVQNSSDASGYFGLGNGSVSILDASGELLTGSNADSKRIQSGGAANDRVRTDAGAVTSKTETASFLAEKGSSGKLQVQVVVFNQDAIIVDVDFANESETIAFDGGNHIDEVNARYYNNGPNGSKRVALTIRYSGYTSGASRRVDVSPNSSTSGEDVVFYHAQIEEAPNASSPIVTGSSAQTRAGDGYVIPKGDWWNTKEGTFIFEFVPQLFYQPFDSKQFGFFDSNGEPTSYFNIYWGDNPAPFEIQVQHNLAGPNGTVAPGTAAAFQKSTFACSFSNSGKLIVSLNGQSNTRQNTKATAPLLEEKDIQMGDASFVRYADISYLPRALPESTLNTLTS